MRLGTSPSWQIAAIWKHQLGGTIVPLLDPPDPGRSAGRTVIPQAQRSWFERETSQDQFELNPEYLKKISPGPVILVDDIVTTGNTLKRAAQTLRSEGFQVELAIAAGSRPERISAVS